MKLFIKLKALKIIFANNVDMGVFNLSKNVAYYNKAIAYNETGKTKYRALTEEDYRTIRKAQQQKTKEKR